MRRRLFLVMGVILIVALAGYDLLTQDIHRNWTDYGILLVAFLFAGADAATRPRLLGSAWIFFLGGLLSLAFVRMPLIQAWLLDAGIAGLLICWLMRRTTKAVLESLQPPQPELSRRQVYASRYWADNYSDGTMDKETEVVAAFLARHARGRVLDFGCGPSFPAWWLAMRDADSLHALDVAPESFEVAEKLLENPYLWIGKFAAYWAALGSPAETGWEQEAVAHLGKIESFWLLGEATDEMRLPVSFDTVAFIYSLGSQKNEEALRQCVRIGVGALVPGGEVLCVNTDGENPNADLPEYTWNGVKNTREIVIDEMTKAGLRIDPVKLLPVEGAPGPYRHTSYYLLRATKPPVMAAPKIEAPAPRMALLPHTLPAT